MKIESGSQSYAAHYRMMIRAEQVAINAKYYPFGREELPLTRQIEKPVIEKHHAMSSSGSIDFQR